MEDNQFLNTLWTRVLLDEQMKVVEVINFDDKLFFGKPIVIGDDIDKTTGVEIVNGISKACGEKRNTFFMYISVYAGTKIQVCAHVEYHNDGSVCLYVTKMHDDDSLVFSKQKHKVDDIVRHEDELYQNRVKTEIAMRSADIMLCEFDVSSKLFFSYNEPINGYDKSKPLTIDQYRETVHPEDKEVVDEFMNKMLAGEDISFNMDIRILLPECDEWQYCTVNVSPYKRDTAGNVVKYVGTRKNNTQLHRRKLLQDKILNSIPLSIIIKDVENDFHYVFCNDESKNLFGTTEENTTYDLMDDDKVELIRKTDLEVFNTGKSYLGSEHIVLKDGRVYDTIVRKSVIEEEGKRLLLSIRWDQSMQNDLQRKSKLFALTLETMKAFTWFYEPGKQRINYGDGFDRNARVSPDINMLDGFLKHVHPDDLERFENSLQEVVAKDNDVWEIEYRIDMNGDGNYEWMDTRGILETTMINDIPCKYMFGMTISIESHKQTEMTLLKNEEQLNKLVHQNELILNNSNSGLAYITTDYIVQWENVSVCSASISYEAYKKGELCYKSAHNRTLPCENCVLQKTLASQQMEQVKFTLNNNRMIEVFATPVFNQDRSVDGIVIRVDDVTEREKMIKELENAKVQAEQSDKLKSAFLANMSHEIRTPLNAIVGFSELLRSTTEDDEKDEYINIINNNNELLLKLINDILDLSKIEAGSIEFVYDEFDISDYFNGMVASMSQRVTNPNVRLIANNPYAGCIVKLDRNRVAQIMANYVTNAIKYTPKGFIEMGYECVDTGVRFYVKDTGIGISDEKKNRVFHRFAKLDEFAQGTGLGLSICKAIVEAMGGSVGFETKYGEGSLFWAFIPCEPTIIEMSKLVSEDNENTDSVTHNVSDNIFAGKTILIAEDIDSNYILLANILKKHFNVLRAYNGQEAVELVRDNAIDLLFMDMKMPVMDGLTATAEIRKFNVNLPVVALTAHAFDSDRMAALSAGCNDYLVKPIDKPRLMSVLKKYCSN